MIVQSLSVYWASLSRLSKRLLVVSVLIFDSCLGLLFKLGLLNFVDFVLLDSLPSDFVWLLQTLQLISMGFGLVKIVFDDLPVSNLRTVLMFASPIFLLLHVLLSLHILLSGLNLIAFVTFDTGTLFVSTLTWSSTYLAIAVGCTLTYSVQRYGNFAQSEYFMLGMYVGIAFMWTDWLFPLSEAPADGKLVWSLFLYVLFFAFILTGIAGVIIDRLVFKGFRDRKSSSDVMMIASLGVAMILRALVYLRFGANSKRLIPDADWTVGGQGWEFSTKMVQFDLGESIWPTFEDSTTNYAYNDAFLPIVVFISVFSLFLLLTHTRLGRRMRAVADNPDLAASSGINVGRVHTTSAFLSAGISGIGGAVFGLTVLFNPQTAFTLLLPAFAVIVLGTIGSVPGAIGASIIIGFVRAISEPILAGIGNPLERTNYFALGGVMPYAMIIAILLIMPQGIGHAYNKWKIERLRKRAESKNEPNKHLSALLGVLFGWVGAHHFHQKRNARGTSILTITLVSYIFGKSTSFMRSNSFVGESVTSAPEGLDPSMHEAWLNLVHNEQIILGVLGFLGDILWPFLPLLIYFFALYESYLIVNDKYYDMLVKPKTRFADTIDKVFMRVNGFFFKLHETLSSQFSGSNKYVDSLNMLISSKVSHYTGRLRDLSSNFYQKVDARYGAESESGSKAKFWVLFSLLVIIVLWLPSVTYYTKVMQLSNYIVTFSIFLLLAYSLNLHTGMTGLLNFGVIFFASVGAIIVGILTAPSDLYGYDWPILPAIIVAMIVGATFGWLLSYPTARLRSDYFAIITISLGEIVRILLMGEPLMRAGGNESAIGVQRYSLPFKEWWFCGSNPPLSDSGEKLSPIACASDSEISSAASLIGDLMGLEQAAPYLMVLAVIGLVAVAVTWKVLDMLFKSPWGRILRAIREDEEVAQHHGHDVLTHKAASLAIGAAIAAFAGALWAWNLSGFQPSFMSPAKSTFLVWAAFIIGGAANNRGMLIGAMIIALTEFFFNVLVAAQGSSSLPLAGLAEFIDDIFVWLVESPFEVASILFILALIGNLLRKNAFAETMFWFSFIFIACGLVFDQRSIDLVFPDIFGGVKTEMAYVKLMLIGLLIMLSLKFNAKGLLPEVPYRPERPNPVGQSSEHAIAAIPNIDESFAKEEEIQDE